LKIKLKQSIAKEKNQKLSLKNIKSNYILNLIFNKILKKKSLQNIKYNKKIQERLKINSNDYKEYCNIEIELNPATNKYGAFINIFEKDERKYYHIYFNDNKEDTKRSFLIKNEKISKIKIIMDYQIKSFNKLFKDCNCIQSIQFKKFNRNNIRDMSLMLFHCSSLEEINFSSFNTKNVTDMSYMFKGCSLLKELNLANFNTNKIKKMYNMFDGCSSLEYFNLSSFNTKNVNI